MHPNNDLDDTDDLFTTTSAVQLDDYSRSKRRRIDSPCDAFKDVFSEYGAKLSPSLMRLQLEGDMPPPFGDD